MDQISLGIIGYGDAAASFVIAAHSLKDWKPVAVGGRNMEKAAAFAEKYGIETRTVKEMTGSEDIEVIAIATPRECTFRIPWKRSTRESMCWWRNLSP